VVPDRLRRPLLPVWLGEVGQEAFAVLEKENAQYRDDRYQYWRSTREPDVSFRHKIPEKQRQYKPGAQREFTIYHGHLGLRAMPLIELHFLRWKEKPESKR
jgi:hypothetical protein